MTKKRILTFVVAVLGFLALSGIFSSHARADTPRNTTLAFCMDANGADRTCSGTVNAYWTYGPPVSSTYGLVALDWGVFTNNFGRCVEIVQNRIIFADGSWGSLGGGGTQIAAGETRRPPTAPPIRK